ncbi:MAG: hypothetical protein ACLRFK_03560 [Alphaproteobacteria bacterium]
MLFFNLDYIKDLKRFAYYKDKVKNSETIIKKAYGNLVVFKLDDIEIRYTFPGCKLTVLDSQGGTEFEMVCTPKDVIGVDEDLQLARSKMFCELVGKIQEKYMQKAVAEQQEKKARMAERAKAARAEVSGKAARIDPENEAKKLAAAKSAIVESANPKKVH